MVDQTRVRAKNNQVAGTGPVVYWMQRDQRVEENWALLYAQEMALARKVSLRVVFNIVPTYGRATYRQYDFMLQGLREVSQALAKLAISFDVVFSDPTETIVAYVNKVQAGELVMDFHPLQTPRNWRDILAQVLPIRVTEVDAHNIIPSWVASEKAEFAAHTFRPKVHRLLPKYLTTFPSMVKHPYPSVPFEVIDWNAITDQLRIDFSVAPVTWLAAGAVAAKEKFEYFLDNKLDYYAEKRNDPNEAGQSDLSPYLHFGQLSAQWIAHKVNAAYEIRKESRDAFLEELIVRRELADNYCYYTNEYDKVTAAHSWAQKTITEHERDAREYVYTNELFEKAATHDELWNAMQRQLKNTGKLHGWCRMYWAKKILEWTPSAQEAIAVALYLNDKYSLDGNDPSGVVGVMWSICGVHDRAWTERPVFGKIRYMNYAGAKRKFNVAEYIAMQSTVSICFNE